MLTAVFTETAMNSPSVFPKINQKLNDLRAALDKATEKLDSLADAVDQMTEDQVVDLTEAPPKWLGLGDDIPGIDLSELTD